MVTCQLQMIALVEVVVADGKEKGSQEKGFAPGQMCTWTE